MNAQNCNDTINLYQYVKYPLRAAQGTILVDDDPFLEVKAYYANASFIELKEIRRKERERLKLKPRQLRPNLPLQITKLVINWIVELLKPIDASKYRRAERLKYPLSSMPWAI